MRPARALGDAHDSIEQRRQDQQEFERRLARNQHDPEARIGLARVLAARGFLSEAVRQVDRVLAVDPERPRDWRLRASFLLEKWREEGERALLEEALDSFLRMAHGERLGDGDISMRAPSPHGADVGFDGDDLILGAELALVVDDAQAMETLIDRLALVPDDYDRDVLALLEAAAAHRAGRQRQAAVAVDRLRAEMTGPLAEALHGLDLAGIPALRMTASEASGEASGETASEAASAAANEASGEASGEAASAAASAAASEAASAAASEAASAAASRSAGAIDFGALELAGPGLSGRQQSPAALGHDALRLAAFWKSLDPTPTTPENEAFLQHCYRVLIADALYGIRPDAARAKKAKPDWARPDAARAHETRTDEPGRSVRGWLTEPGRLFVRYGSQRVELTSRFGNEVSSGTIWNQQFGRGLGFEDADGTEPRDIGGISVAEKLVVLDPTLPTLHTREIPGGPVRFAQSGAIFSGLRRDARLSMAVSIPAAELEAGETEPRDDWSDVEVRWAVFDEDWRTIAERAMAIDSPECIAHDATGRVLLVARADFDLDAGNYIMATEFTDPVSGREGTSRQEIRIDPVQGMLSDIELCRHAFRADDSRGRHFKRFDADIIPNAIGEVASGEELRFYYEIYNLGRNRVGRRRCVIRYAIHSIDSQLGPGVVHPLTYDMSIDEPVQMYDAIMPRLGSLKVDRLPTGIYELQVEVEDQVSGVIDVRRVQFRRI